MTLDLVGYLVAEHRVDQLRDLEQRVTREVVFFAAGVARPKGSHKALLIGGHARLAPASGQEKGWRASVASAACEAMRAAGVGPIDGCVSLLLEFYSPRPKSHTRKNGAIKTGVQPRPTTAPDADKLARSVGDALNEVCYRDDSQICELVVRKLYTDVTLRPFVGA